jgi:hypothetical protein
MFSGGLFQERWQTGRMFSRAVARFFTISSREPWFALCPQLAFSATLTTYRGSPLNQKEFGLERGRNCLNLGREALSDLREMRIEDPNDCGWKLLKFV